MSKHYTHAETIAFMNARYAWIKALGRVADVGGAHIEYRGTDGFRTSYDNRKVQLGEGDESKLIPMATYWLKSAERRTYGKVGLWAPPKEAQPGDYNLWKGFAIEPIQGEWSLMQDHILQIIAAGDEELAKYILKWIAWMFQNPGIPAEAAIAMRGIEGCGKGTLGNALKTIMGAHAVHVTSPEHFVMGRFNAHMAQCIFFFADECHWAGERVHEGKLKALITEPTIRVEPKGIDSYEIDNALHVLISSNNDWVIPAGTGARRFVVADVAPIKAGNFEYFAALRKELNSGGLQAMLYDLLNIDLGDWHPREIVSSKGLNTQKEFTLDTLSMWTLYIAESGHLPHTDNLLWQGEKHPDPNFVSSATIRQHMLSTFPQLRFTDDKKLARALREHLGCVKSKTQHCRGWVFPDLEQARDMWSQSHYKQDWDDTTSWL
jgi:hypothetical protein